MAEAATATKESGTKEDGTKTRKPRKELSAEEMREKLAKNRAEEQRLIADLAIKEHPELENDIRTVSEFVRDLQKIDMALKSGAETNVQKEKERLKKVIESYKEKIAGAEAALAKADSTTIVDGLKSDRQRALKSLGDAVKTVNTNFASMGVTVTDLIPTVEPYLKEVGQ